MGADATSVKQRREVNLPPAAFAAHDRTPRRTCNGRRGTLCLRLAVVRSRLCSDRGAIELLRTIPPLGNL